jgi:hypothetical protein
MKLFRSYLSLFVGLNLFFLSSLLGADSNENLSPTNSNVSTITPSEAGKISFADLTTKIIKIVNSSNREKSFTISSGTRIVVNGQPGKMNDLGPGMDVTVVSGEYPSIAQSIVATGIATEKPKTDPTRSTNLDNDKKGKKKKKN